MRLILASLIVIATALPAAAQNKTYEIRQPTGPWRVPGEIQKPRDVWQQPGEIQVPRGILKGFGKAKPAAPNTTADGQDDPEGRQKNRRVEVVFDTCK